MTRDFSKVRACGPWVYIRKVDPGDPYTLSAHGSGLYFPKGDGAQRVANGRGLVISAGRGCTVQDGGVNVVAGYEEGEFAAMPADIVPGAVVAYRGYLEGANHVHQLEGQDYCFIHMTSLFGVWEGIELEEKDEKLVERSPFFDVAEGFIPEDGVFAVDEAHELKGPIVVGADFAKK
jgi:hypothetical protein